MNYKTYEVKEFKNGDIEYLKDGKLHRENDKPACETTSGYKAWYKHGVRHRDNGPAIIFASGTIEYRKDGKLHREDGPAIEWSDGTKSYYLNGILYTKENYYKKLNGKTYNIKGKQVSEDTIHEALKHYINK